MKDTGECGAQAVLSQAELSVIEALPGGAHEVARELSCGLETEHPGPHLALAQAYGKPERSRWLKWDGNSRNWMDVDDGEHCLAEAR